MIDWSALPLSAKVTISTVVTTVWGGLLAALIKDRPRIAIGYLLVSLCVIWFLVIRFPGNWFTDAPPSTGPTPFPYGVPLPPVIAPTPTPTPTPLPVNSTSPMSPTPKPMSSVAAPSSPQQTPADQGEFGVRSSITTGQRAGEERTFEISDGVMMIFCWCPAGTFLMGTPATEPSLEGQHEPSEKQVSVTLSQGFWMAKYECTQAQWKAVMGSNPSDFTNAGATGPVEQVSWNDCYQFTRRLIDPPKPWRFELPTEAQWEYACRAGTITPFSVGNGKLITSKQANFHPGFHFPDKWQDSIQNGPYLWNTVKVGSYPPNRWGLCDMQGNVSEWCRDRYAENLPGGIDPIVLHGTDSGSDRNVLRGTNVIHRGGSWHNFAEDQRSGDRYYIGDMGPDAVRRDVGFRLAIVSN